MSIELTIRDLDLLRTLTRRIRVLNHRCAAPVWWPDTPHSRRATRRIQQLINTDWLESHLVNAHPPLLVERPLFAWQPNGPSPEPEDVALACRGRWTSAALPTEVLVASPKSAALFGSSARGLPPAEHLNHDLRLAAVYLHYRSQQPQLAALWRGEHCFGKAGYRIKDPDAFLVDPQGRVRRVIESAGRYSAAQVESFHKHCAEYSLPYELW